MSDHLLIADFYSIFIFLVYPRRNITFWKWVISNNRSLLYGLFSKDALRRRARYLHVNMKKVPVCVVCGYVWNIFEFFF